MSQPTYMLPPGFTPQADADFQQGATMVLVHRWPPGWSPGTLADQWVQTPVRLLDADGGSLFLRVAGGGREFRVARTDIKAWVLLDALINTEVQPVVQSWSYPPSPLTPSGFQ